MPSTPRVYEFSENDRLYTDHLGRRVVADWEGDGVLDGKVSGGEAWLETGEGRITWQGGRVSFKGYGLVVAEDGGSTRVSMESDLGGIGGSLELLDSFSIGDLEGLKARDWRVQNISERIVLSASFANGEILEAECAAHLNAVHWRVDLPRPVDGLVLRKVYDRFHGRQRARVLVDGEFAGMWYEPVEDRVNRWGGGEFWVPGRFEGSVMVTIDPPSGTPLWSVGRIEVFNVIV